MSDIIFAGECMVEFRKIGLNNYGRSFAGDVYNSSVYAKRTLGNEVKVSFLTALGTDSLSNEMLEQWQQAQLDTSLVYRTKDAIPGSYLIETDVDGERYFTYWRGQSAARQAVQLLNDSGRQLVAPTMFYFSGISLAILSIPDRESLLKIIRKLKIQGTRIVFDPNYRASLWSSVAQAQLWINRAYQISDIALPGLDDEAELYGLAQPDQVMKRLSQFNIDEIILKAGKLGVYGRVNGQSFRAPFVSPLVVVDTTAAGDSFDAVYIARRLQGYDTEKSANEAAQAASFVVGHAGAIVPEESFRKFLLTIG